MADYAYTQVAGKMREFMRRIRETGIPTKVTQEWLTTLGYKSTNDRTLIPVLKMIGLVDSTGIPTERWRQYRGADHAAVLASGIRLGYQDLFAMYEDACSRGASDLQHFFGTKTSAGQRVVQLMVQTFKALCELGDFSSEATPQADVIREQVLVGAGGPRRVVTPASPAMTVNINVQLTLPETSDELLYDRFFAAFRKHLVDRSPE